MSTSSGLLIVDKPAGWTSHDVVARARKLMGTRKIGHAGTLDPMATGLLVLGVNQGTRLLNYLVGASKSYEATIRLGQATVTDDAEGEITDTQTTSDISEAQIRAEIARLTGEIQQVPSSVSAIKVDGKRSYARVRAGEEVTLAARPVTISRFDMKKLSRVNDGDAELVDLEVSVDCSTGTYIRALARDLGANLGGSQSSSEHSVGGHLTSLRRTAVGPIKIDQAQALAGITEAPSLMSLAEAAAYFMPVRKLDAAEAVELGYGRRIAGSMPGEPMAGVDAEGALVAILADSGPSGQAKPMTVFAPQVGNSA